tara:strand:- start:2611 stop:3519 length:909 start_codon:yes stop_codon:yes gene_type:complete
MQNIHIEHPEDSILNGDLSVLNWFTANSNVTIKIDGSPAIVWGRNPSTGNFFVGTKSVFNKIKIKINESHQQIDNNHQGEVAEILHHCFDYLPRTNNIYQGDFIGFGGNSTYCPNTITYDFPEKLTQNIIIAPHTYYEATTNRLRDCIKQPLKKRLTDTSHVLFVRPNVKISDQLDDIQDVCNFAKQIATLCDFPSNKQVTRIKKQLNTCIREGLEIDDLTLDALASDNNVDINVLRLWKLVESIKMDMFCYLHPDDDIQCSINDHYVDHEGYVMWNEFGLFKIVDRRTFSYHNFHVSRNRN